MARRLPTTSESPRPSSEEGVPRRGRERGLLSPAVRVVLALLGAVAGYQVADRLHGTTVVPDFSDLEALAFLIILTLAGLVLGYLLGVVVSRLVRLGLDLVDERLSRASGSEVVVAVVGVLIGLGIAGLVSLALVNIPYVGAYLPIPVFLLSGYFVAYVAVRKHVEILRMLGLHRGVGSEPGQAPSKLVDSSAIIDGRLVGVVRTGFVEGDLLVPRFVVEELQRLADSADAEKRVRGRRGLDYVRRLQDASERVRIESTDYADTEGVDAKLVRLAQQIDGQIVSTDHTLAKVAQIQGVAVLNVNDLADAVKAAVLPGEQIEVKILREGREHDQGVGYLDDGTMIVVEQAAALVGAQVQAEVTSVLQSPSGKMIFGRLVR
jgi:uncharacterized protein YacL